MKRYLNTDLAVENKAFFNNCGREYYEEENEISTICRLNISNDELSKKYGREKGIYVTILSEAFYLLDKFSFLSLADILAKEIRKILFDVCKRKCIKDCSVLVAGLGNAEIVVDAIGPISVKKLTVTRHIKFMSESYFTNENMCSVSAIAPGVLSQTGIETVELIKGAVKSIHPDVVIAIDSLSARSVERLGTTIQISDNGIAPGTGIGNMRKAINAENIGCPVISIGVPTVVSSSTLVIDMLETAGVSEISDELMSVLKENKKFFVTPKECDEITKSAAELISTALDMMFGMHS